MTTFNPVLGLTFGVFSIIGSTIFSQLETTECNHDDDTLSILHPRPSGSAIDYSCEGSPGVRNGHAMVFHEGMQQLFLFGGANEKEVLGDTWVWSDAGWTELAAKGPAPRTFAAMIYRNQSDDVVLFGGNKVLFGSDDKSNVLLNDTWIWKEGKWRQIETNDSPEPRSEAAIAYDLKGNNVVLFGGFTFSDDGKSLIRFNDTWEFDGENWNKIETQGRPSARSGSVFVFSKDDQASILFGGNFSRKPEDISNYNGAMWKYQSGRWTAIKNDKPNIYNPAMTYESEKNSLLLFGGWDGSKRINDTWRFNKGKWHVLQGASPDPRNHTKLIYDVIKKRALLFGGHNGDEVFGDLWEFKYDRWNKLMDCPKRKRVDNLH